MSTTTFMLGSTCWSESGYIRPWVSTVRTANQYSASRGARKVNEGRSGVVRLAIFQVNPESSETQSCTSESRGRSAGSTLNGMRNDRLLW